ncbi:NAD(P)/FAD-dependent oxidoreductase [Agromyces sp. NPDC060279]|uniref:NAD(P)/FAD-dependent oxidoreductase n=1 Tax=Agromyces sp. NPDC060279 TaxID=3347092 RepID=UPI003655469B
MSTTPLHVAVVGGGILGASTAAQLARGGARVTLITAGRLADGASGRSIAWLNSSGDRSSAYHYLRLLALDRYRSWRAARPESAGYLRFDGGMKWAGPGESFRDTFAFERSVGYDSVWVERDEVAAFAPDVDASAVAEEGAIFNPGEGWVSLPELIAALVADAEADGARVIEHAGAARVSVDAGAARGVVLADGTLIEADRVVLATGAGVPVQLAELGAAIPDATPGAFVLFTDPVEPAVRTVLNTPRVAVRPTPDGRLVLDADWAEQTVTIAEDGTVEVPAASVQGLLDEASRVLAGGPRLRAARVGAGLKPIPGDGEPVVGAVPSIDGLYAVFTHSGATLGLILGELLAEEVLSGTPSPVLAAFGLGRFDGGQAPGAVGTGAWAPVGQR